MIRPRDMDNLVFSLGIYEWAADLDIPALGELFEHLSVLMERPPDDVRVCQPDTWKGKGYTYRYYTKHRIIEKNTWASLGYHWRRQSDWHSYFSAKINVGLDTGKKFAIVIDESAVSDAVQIFEGAVKSVCELLEPLNGIAFWVPYRWSPVQFLAGQGSGYIGPETGLRYDSPEAFCVRGLHAGRLLIGDRSRLFTKLRDIFPINLISKRHLAHMIEGGTLENWIGHGGHGTLRQVTPVTYRWDVPKNIQPKVRKAVIAAGLIADPFWTKLGWIDD